MGVARIRRGGAIAVTLASGIAFPSIAHAGFFDFLFGQPERPAVRPYEPYPNGLPYWGTEGFRRRADRGFHRHGHKLMGRRKVVVADNHPVGPLAPTDLMDDDSLRPGDAVVTPSGIRIFIGSSGSHHGSEDFRKPSDIKGLPKRERKALAALDAQDSGTDGKPGIATGRSASELKLVFGETIIDPQGHSIRYVGP